MDARADLSAARRSRELEGLVGSAVDLVVIGGGITGCGVALDAASRGLSVALLEKDDLAHGTSRFSSKLIHGGLRYIAQGQLAVAAESARERHHLMTAIAPHLVRPLATVIPFNSATSKKTRATLRIGYRLGDVLRRSAHTPPSVLGRSARVDANDALGRVPALAADELDGALIGWDGQLEDDARLVTAVARTAASYGAKIITRAQVREVERGRVRAKNLLTGEDFEFGASHVINATGIWAGELAENVRLTPSKGSHVIVPAEALGNPSGSLTVRAEGGGAQYVFAIPTHENTVMIGLTDTPFDGPLPEEPTAEEWEIDLLLATISSALDAPLTRSDVIGSFAGLRPLLAPEEGSESTADVSRQHKVIEDPASGALTLVGGKMTTYRQMAEDAVDRITDERCVTKTLPLVGAHGAKRADQSRPPRLVRRFGAETDRVIACAEGEAALLEPITDGSEISAAELRFGASCELALTVDDLLDRRTRAGLTPKLKPLLISAAQDALEWAAESSNQQIHTPGVTDEQHAATD